MYLPSYAKLLKDPENRSRVMRIRNFQVHTGTFARNENFFGKAITVTYMYLLFSFNAQNLKKSFEWIKSYDNTQFL